MKVRKSGVFSEWGVGKGPVGDVHGHFIHLISEWVERG